MTNVSLSICEHRLRKMRKITSVAAVRAAEAQGVVTYMQDSRTRGVASCRVVREVAVGGCMSFQVRNTATGVNKYPILSIHFHHFDYSTLPVAALRRMWRTLALTMAKVLEVCCRNLGCETWWSSCKSPPKHGNLTILSGYGSKLSKLWYQGFSSWSTLILLCFPCGSHVISAPFAECWGPKLAALVVLLSVLKSPTLQFEMHGKTDEQRMKLDKKHGNKMKPTNPNADTYVEKQRLNTYLSQFPANPFVEHPDLTHWGDTLVGHPCLTLLRYALVRHSCITLWFDTLAGHSCLTLF